MLLCVLVSFFTLNIVTISCIRQGSLTFVIDDTASMRREIEQVKIASESIMDVIWNKKSTPIQNFVLATINDPVPKKVVKIKTRDKDELLPVLRTLNTYGGGDCPEYSLTSIEIALKASLTDSYFFVFTDASPKDNYKVQVIKDLAQEKGCQIVFVLTPAPRICRLIDKVINFRFYDEIASATFGQVFNLDSKQEVQDILRYVDTVVAGDKAVIYQEVIPPKTPTTIRFTIDSQTEYAVISTSGKNVQLSIIKGPLQEFEKITWIHNAKVIKLTNPPPGDYVLLVSADSATSVMIFGRTDFTFEHGFSVVPTTSLNKTDKQPVDGSKSHLLIHVTDEAHSVEIKTAQILKMDGQIYLEMPLRRVNEDLYTTEAFMPTREIFLIAVNGNGIKTHRPIRRIAKTPIETRKQDIKPRVTFDKTKMLVDYDSSFVLRCNVQAHPKPNITWSLNNGSPLTNMKEDSSPPYTYISYVKINHFKKSEHIQCKASNEIGTTYQYVEVNIKNPFNNTNDDNAIIKIKFGGNAQVYCNITSSHPMIITWYKEKSGTRKAIVNSEQYSIENDGSILNIRHMDANLEGQYICYASIKGDEETNWKTIRKVEIMKVQPKIQRGVSLLEVDKGAQATINCQILDGYPRPTISWVFRRDPEGFRKIPGESNNALRIKGVDLQTAGIYTCEAKNEVGSDSKSIELVVKAQPRITVLKSLNNNVETDIVEYNGEVTLMCQTSAFPLPKIVWLDSNNNEIPSSQISSQKQNEIVAFLIQRNIKRSTMYKCKATNKMGEDIQHVNIKVNSPFRLPAQQQITQDVEFDKSALLICPVKSPFPLYTTWSKLDDSNNYMSLGEGSSYKIHKVHLGSQGRYMCKASLANDREISSEELIIDVKIPGIVKPNLEKRNDALNVKENVSVTLTCRILKSQPIPLISWEFKKEGTEFYEKRTEIGELLTIQKAGLQDAGNYRCIADNGVGKDERVIKLIVEAAPKIHEDKAVQTAVESDAALRLPCNATGYPKPTIVWTIDGNEIKSDGKKYVIIDGTLVIKNPLMSDSNNYTCIAKNEFGTDRTKVETYISQTFDFDEDHGDEEYIYILKGDTKSLTCGKEKSEKVVWYKEQYRISESRSLTINNANVNDDGNYTCRVSTLEYVTARTYVVDVGFAPVFEYETDTEVDWDGDDQMLRCDVVMKPYLKTVKIQWTYNGKVLKTKSDFQNIIGWGNYTCNIANIHGEKQRNFSVYSSQCLIRKDVPIANMPVVLNKDSMWPTFDTVSKYYLLGTADEIKLSCNNQAKRPNSFKKIPGKHEIVVVCNHEDKFTVGVGDGTYMFEDFTCEYPVLPAFQTTSEKCVHENTELIKVGFESDSFVEAYEVCYDKSNENALYTRIDMSMPMNMATVKAPVWMNYTLATDDGDYNCTGNATCCYARAQLVNAQDVKFGPPQTATNYIRLNSVPLWRACDRGEVLWEEVETTVREILLELGSITVWTGASEFTVRGKKRSPNIQDKPRYLWKVVKSEYLIFSIIYVNDPAPTSSDVRCRSICPAGVLSSTYTYCCALIEFSKAFGIAESVFTV